MFLGCLPYAFQIIGNIIHGADWVTRWLKQICCQSLIVRCVLFQVDKQVAVWLTRGPIIFSHEVLWSVWVHLSRHDRDLLLVTWILEHDEIAAVETHGPVFFAFIVQVLLHTYHTDVSVMRTLGEQITHVTRLGAFSHLIVHYEEGRLTRFEIGVFGIFPAQIPCWVRILTYRRTVSAISCRNTLFWSDEA